MEELPQRLKRQPLLGSYSPLPPFEHPPMASTRTLQADALSTHGRLPGRTSRHLAKDPSSIQRGFIPGGLLFGGELVRHLD